MQEKNGLFHGIKPLFFNNFSSASCRTLKTLIFCTFFIYKYIDQLITKIKNDELTVESAVAEAQKTDHMFQLCGIHSMDDLSECLYNEVS